MATSDTLAPLGLNSLGQPRKRLPRLNEGGPLKWKSPDELYELAAAYFMECSERKEPVTITGLAIALGTTRETLNAYANGDGYRHQQFSYVIKRLRHFCEHYAETQMFTARNPAGAIFALKNYGWKDTPSVQITNQQLVIPAELYDKYKPTIIDKDTGTK